MGMARTRHGLNHASRLEPNTSNAAGGSREPPRRKPRAWPVPGTAPITHLDWNSIPQTPQVDPVSRLGASRGHGQHPAPPQSRTSIGTQSPQTPQAPPREPPRRKPRAWPVPDTVRQYKETDRVCSQKFFMASNAS